MRLQTMYLPTAPGAERIRFALIADQVDPGQDDDQRQENLERLWTFSRACGASAVLVTPDTVEVHDPDLAGGDAPAGDVHLHIPEQWQKLGETVADIVHARTRAHQRAGRPR